MVLKDIEVLKGLQDLQALKERLELKDIEVLKGQ